MLFSSFDFILIFLPLTLTIWQITLKIAGLRTGITVLAGASLIFYAYWNLWYLPLLAFSIIVNFHCGQKILNAKWIQKEKRAKNWLRTGIIFNLTVLGIFKYAYFIASNIIWIGNWKVPFEPLLLPLGISFITFQKIAYLIDCKKGLVTQHDFIRYLFFVTFFPQLIAGPIVHHRPLITQIDIKNNYLLFTKKHWPIAISLFTFGLFKKIGLADNFAHLVTPIFNLSGAISGAQAWQGMLAYSLQLYFDFSGYSDMAIGLGLLFGFKLPVNFNSPYQAHSIIDFWRRWHMTLSAFLRDYVYIPLGGNKRGIIRRFINLMLTMLLGGLWHGAGWTFILWGGLHGCYLLINHIWKTLILKCPICAIINSRIPIFIWIMITFLFVALAWVLFRASTLSIAFAIYQGLLNGNEILISLKNAPWIPNLTFWQLFFACRAETTWAWIILGLTIVWLLPTGWRWISYDPTPNQSLETSPGIWAGLITGLLLWLSFKIMLTSPASDFLYFNF